MTEIISDKEIQEFERSFCPYSYLEIKFALQHFLNYEIEDNLYAIINDFSKETGTELENIDPCYLAYDFVLQKVRKQIKETVGFDIQGDEILFGVHGNFSATRYVWEKGRNEKLLEIIKNSSKEEKETLGANANLINFLVNEFQIEIENILQDK